MEENNERILKTGISQAFWYHNGSEKIDEAFEAVEINKSSPFFDKKCQYDKSSLCWFDRLFSGGIRIPNTDSHPTIILLMGPPGSGKSTLALELCYRIAKNQIRMPNGKYQILNAHPIKSAYISTEVTASQLKQKVSPFGWDEKYFIEYKKHLYEYANNEGFVTVFGMDAFRSGANILEILNTALDYSVPIAKDIISVTNPGGGQVINTAIDTADKFRTNTLVKKTKNKLNLFNTINNARQLQSDIVIFDSLNNIPTDKYKERMFMKISKRAADANIKVLVFILDTDAGYTNHKFWEYTSDYIIKIVPENYENYYVRTLEVTKSRYCENMLGKQIFLYPSLHYYLSVYKRAGNDDQHEKKYAKTYPNNLNHFIKQDMDGLFPTGRCTALIGERGGHKSHLGYLHILNTVIVEKESGIIISLRDDEEMTRQALITILNQEEYLIHKAKELLCTIEESSNISTYQLIEKMENEGILEILYYHPGYITPEEFTHRMLISVWHHKEHGNGMLKCIKGNYSETTVLFNSLDQISSRFPLCAKLNIFIPGIVDILNGEKVTSIFVAVDTQDQPVEQYGILPMADLVLFFKRRTFYEAEYGKIIANMPGTQKKLHDSIVVENIRSAGGEMAGAVGILELISSERQSNYKYYNSKGLKFTVIDRNDLKWLPADDIQQICNTRKTF